MSHANHITCDIHIKYNISLIIMRDCFIMRDCLDSGSHVHGLKATLSFTCFPMTSPSHGAQFIGVYLREHNM